MRQRAWQLINKDMMASAFLGMIMMNRLPKTVLYENAISSTDLINDHCRGLPSSKLFGTVI